MSILSFIHAECYKKASNPECRVVNATAYLDTTLMKKSFIFLTSNPLNLNSFSACHVSSSFSTFINESKLKEKSPKWSNETSPTGTSFSKTFYDCNGTAQFKKYKQLFE